ncbi:MAG: radical SAM family heme chaperone HemW [Marinibacterium sp.]
MPDWGGLRPKAGFGLYVHWPFCAAKCPYCDFNSHVSTDIDADRWQRAYLREIDRLAGETRGRVLDTIFFGGGTPSLMPPDIVGEIIDAARSVWRSGNDMEITLEANPGSVEAGRFAGFHAAGVNRVSLGVQALRDRDLQRLGRIHTVSEARAALDIARKQFDRVSFDLIYARQDQSLSDWRDELTEALDLGPDHLSLYQLTIEDGTVFARRRKAGGLHGLPDDDLAADLFDLAQDLCTARGLPAYEVSNHARPGQESRHNLIYWRAGDYAGIGPGAHGRLTLDGKRIATQAPAAPSQWLTDVDAGFGEMPRRVLSPLEHAQEYLMMCMRTSEGLDVGIFAELAGGRPDPGAIQQLMDLHLVDLADGRLLPTLRGRAVLNQVIAALWPEPL